MVKIVKYILFQRKMVLASPLQRLLLNFNCRARRTANLNLNCQTLIPKTHIVPNSFINGRPFSIGISPRKNNISYNNSAHSNFCRLREKSVFEHCKAQVSYNLILNFLLWIEFFGYLYRINKSILINVFLLTFRCYIRFLQDQRGIQNGKIYNIQKGQMIGKIPRKFWGNQLCTI